MTDRVPAPSTEAGRAYIEKLRAVAAWLHQNASTRRRITCGPDSTGCRNSHRLDAQEILRVAGLNASGQEETDAG